MRMDRTHPRASAQLLDCEVDGGLVYAAAAKRLDDLTLPEKGRKDAAYILSSVRNEHHHEQRARVLTGS